MASVASVILQNAQRALATTGPTNLCDCQPSSPLCLAGDAGLRVGEVKALRWREDVDMIAKTITVNFQTRNKQTTTPKGRTRRFR